MQSTFSICHIKLLNSVSYFNDEAGSWIFAVFCEYQLSCHDALAFCGDSIRLPWIDWQIAIDCQNVCHALRKRCRGYCGKWHQLVQLCVRVPIMFFLVSLLSHMCNFKVWHDKKTRYNQTETWGVFLDLAPVQEVGNWSWLASIKSWKLSNVLFRVEQT